LPVVAAPANFRALAALAVAAAVVPAATLSEQQQQQIQAAAVAARETIIQTVAAVAVPAAVELSGFVTRAQPLDRSLRAQTASTRLVQPAVSHSTRSLNPETW
jgi:hypothetical protein